MDFPGRKFEASRTSGNGNGHEGKGELRKSPGEMLRSKIGELSSQARAFEAEIRILTQALAEGAREINDADIKKINGDLQTAVERFSKVLDTLRNLEKRMKN